MDFETTLLDFSIGNNKDVWTLRDAVKGVQILGGIGSGKTSGSGHTIASAFLKNGFGGLVLCAKPDERENWERLISKFGRLNDLIIIGEGKGKYFNPLAYENNRKGGGDTFNLVNLFMQIYNMGRMISGEGLGSGGERFWDNALKRCISRLIDMLNLAEEDISIANMHRLITDNLTNDEILKLYEAREKLKSTYKETTQVGVEIIKELASYNYYAYCLGKFLIRRDEFKSKIKELPDNQKLVKKAELEKLEYTYKITRNYFERELPKIGERTKNIIIESFLGIAEPFLGGILKEYFANGTNITPEDSFYGKIILLDFPVKKYLDSGLYAQGIFKLLWQQSVERRSFEVSKDLPVFLWVDESQLFLNTYDQIYQTTARSSGACTVFLTQNISNYYAAIGGKNPTPKVDSLLGNLSTKIFHANGDPVTNEWAARSIGKDYRLGRSFSLGDSKSYGGSEQLQHQINPITFTKLKTGGKANKNLVEGIMTVNGKVWSDGNNYLLLSINQNS